MLTQLKSLIRSLRVPTLAEQEMNYLNESRDRIDLEFRQRQIDRGLFRKAW